MCDVLWPLAASPVNPARLLVLNLIEGEVEDLSAALALVLLAALTLVPLHICSISHYVASRTKYDRID